VCVCFILLPYRQASRRSASFSRCCFVTFRGLLGEKKRYQMCLEMKPYANTPRTRTRAYASRRATLLSVFRAFIGTLSSKSSGAFFTSQLTTTHTYKESREIKLHPPSTFLFLLLLLLVWLFDAIYKTDRQRKCNLFLLHRRRRARVFSIAPFRAANEEEKSRDFREDASVTTAKTFASSSRRHPRR